MTGSAIAGAYLLLFVDATATTIPMKNMDTCWEQGRVLRSELDRPKWKKGHKPTFQENAAQIHKSALVRYYTCIKTGY